jgi:hypothetical protein
MQIFAHHQAGLRCDQRHIAWWLILREVYPAPGYHHLIQEWIERDKGIRAHVAGKRDALVGEKLLHHGCAPGSHHEHHIDLPG